MKKLFLLGFFLLLACMQMAYAQGRTVTGTVTSATDGASLPGVNVSVKGTAGGTVTDADGRYSIAVPGADAVLMYSFVGTITQEIPVGNQSVVNVQLRDDVRQLGEVVVTAFGVERETKSLGFSVTEVDNEELVRGRATNVVNGLSGKVAGVRIQSASGSVGASAGIFIRGFTTFTGTNQPLFVVDGIPIDNGGGENALQAGVANSNRAIDIPQDDIESVSILKGPAAAVLYGSRAAAGAVIITTKRGTRDKKQTVNFTTNYNVVEVNRFPDYQNTYGQGNNGVFNALTPNSWGPRAEGQTVTNFRGQEEALTINPNNVRDIFRRGSNFQNNISLSGGGEKGNYFLSYGNLRETGILENNELNRNSVTFNGTTQFTERFRSGVSVIYTNNRSSRSQQGNQLANPFFRTWFLPRSYDVNNYPWETPQGLQQRPGGANPFNPGNTWYGADDNPLWTLRRNLYNDNVNRVVGNVNFAYDIMEGLTFDYRLGIDSYTEEIKRINQRTSSGGSAAGGVGSIINSTFTRQELSSYANLTYNRRLSDMFGLRLLVGNEINQRVGNFNQITGNDIQVPFFENIGNTLNYNPFESRTRQRLVGVYADAQFDYGNFLFLGLTGRNDWSSTFNPDQRSYFYPSVTTSFVFTDAFSALRGNVLTFGKIRANIAQVGREAPLFITDTYFGSADPFDSFLGGSSFIFPFQGQLGYQYSATGGNPLLGPEFTTTYEIGTDLRFFNGRLNFDVAYFNQQSKDIIFAVPVASASGFTNQFQNIGRSRSHGLELLVSGTPVKTPRFTWDISANWSRIRNEVLELAPGVDQITLGGFVTPSTRLIAGQPYGVIFGSVFNRHENGELLVNQNGSITLAAENQIIGDPNPKGFGGLTNSFTFGGFNVSALLDVRYGGDIISRNISDLRRSGAAIETADRDRPYIHQGVFADGTPNNIEISAQQYYDERYGFGRAEFVIFDSSWLRLRELSVSYKIPAAVLEGTFLGNVEVGINGRNLLLYAPNVPHIDPEVNAQGVSNSQGLEFNAMPQTRQYGGLIRITF
jgi:TonB-linked SusC/RagA family outer membrane protein